VALHHNLGHALHAAWRICVLHQFGGAWPAEERYWGSTNILGLRYSFIEVRRLRTGEGLSRRPNDSCRD
jgi:hypothetical protein